MIYLLAFGPTLAFFALCCWINSRPHSSYVGHPPTAAELIGRALLPVLRRMGADMVEFGRALKATTDPVGRFAGHLRKIQEALDRETVEQEWRL